MKFNWFILPLILFSLATQATESSLSTTISDTEIKLSRHKPMYFLLGTPESKVQLSFKTIIIRDGNTDIFFGYTQTMLWGLFDDSSPFNDINYNPEIFYRHTLSHSFVNSVDFGFFDHISNGKGGEESRAVDSSYLQFNSDFYFSRQEAHWSTRFYHIHGLGRYNTDYKNYVGPFETKVSVSRVFDELISVGEFYVRWRPGGFGASDLNRGNIQIGTNVQLKDVKFKPSLYIQYFSGYAESLINYDQRSESVRIGLKL